MKTIREALDACTQEQYEHVLHLWGMDGEPKQEKRSLRETLLKRMHNRIAAHFVYEYLSYDERIVLYRALLPSARNGIQHEALMKKTQLSQERYDAAVEKLRFSLLVQEEKIPMYNGQPAYLYAISSKKAASAQLVAHLVGFQENIEVLNLVGREIFTAKGDLSAQPFEKLLSIYHDNDLFQVARAYGLSLTTYYSADLRFELAEALLSIEEPLAYLPYLDESARKLFLWLREHGGKATMREARAYMALDDAALSRMLLALLQCALVFDTFSQNERILFIPQERYNSLSGIRPESASSENYFVPMEQTPVAIRASESGILFDLATVVGATYQQSLEPTQAGNVPKRFATKIRALLRGYVRLDYQMEDIYLEMVFEVARNLQLIQLTKPPLEDMKARYEPTRELATWATLSTAGQTQRVFTYWQNNFSWRDVYGANYTPWNVYSWDASGGRKALVKQLRACIPGRWYRVDVLLQKLWDEDAFAFRPPQSFGARPLSRRKTSEQREHWNSCEGEVYKGILASTLYEMGVVDLSYDQQEAITSSKQVDPTAFLITPLGHAVLTEQKEQHDASTTTRSLVVQPNFELLLLQPDFPTLYALLPFAQVQQIGMVSRLALTKASLLKGIDAGRSVEQIVQTLAERSQKELPQNVEYTIRDWTKQHKVVQLSQVILFEVSSEEGATQLCALPALQEFDLRQIAPRLLALAGDVDLSKLRRILEKEGVSMRVSGEIFTRPKYTSHYTLYR